MAIVSQDPLYPMPDATELKSTSGCQPGPIFRTGWNPVLRGFTGVGELGKPKRRAESEP